MMRTNVMIAPLLLGLALVVGACGDDSPPGQDSGPEDDAGPPDPDAGPDPDAAPEPDAGPLGDVALEDLPAVLEDAVCAFEVRCGVMPDEATCRNIFDPAQTDVGQLAAFVDGGELTYDPTKAGQCLQAYRDAACTWVGIDAGPAPVCDEVFTGDVAEDGACLVDEQCAGAMICETEECAAGCCAGTCKAKDAAVAVGEDCHRAECVVGAYCHVDDSGGAVCVQQGAVNEPCGMYDGCVAGAVCKREPDAPGLCVELADRGAACDLAIAEPHGGCLRFDDWCNPASEVCEQRAAIGATCSVDAQCVEASACVGGTCTVRPTVGQGCGRNATGGSCLGDLTCTGAGVCAVTPAVEVCP